jgi:hypothetical protein
MQRITDIWRNLVRYPGREEAEAEHATDNDEDSSSSEDAIAETYRNMYWTRIISIQRPDVQVERHPIAEDVHEAV